MKRRPNASDLLLAQRAAEAIRELYPEAEVILYGSRARGKPVEFSDLDLLVLTNRRLNFQEEMAVIDTVFDLELETGIIICPIVEERARWYTEKYQVMPLAKAVEKEGIPL